VLLPLALIYHAQVGTDVKQVLYGFLTASALALFLHYGYGKLRGREVLGFGDVKFFAVAGLWLGLYGLVPFLFYAGFIGTLLGIGWRLLGKGAIFPFGPALAITLFALVIYPSYTTNLFWEKVENTRTYIKNM
jgi:prepilin signal peptidase PulO-like enzyme (type II secretory pathway)